MLHQKPTSASFPNGLPHLRGEAEVRAAAYRQLNGALADLCASTLGMAAQMMEALEMTRRYLPAEAQPVLDILAKDFAEQRGRTSELLKQVAT